MNIVLVEPEIPQNTGNIVRTCAATGTRLHIVKPMGFDIDDKKLKRAGLDYWHFLGIKYYENLDDFFEKNKGCRFFCLSSAVVCRRGIPRRRFPAFWKGNARTSRKTAC